jgi:hypothetical protein
MGVLLRTILTRSLQLGRRGRPVSWQFRPLSYGDIRRLPPPPSVRFHSARQVRQAGGSAQGRLSCVYSEMLHRQMRRQSIVNWPLRYGSPRGWMAHPSPPPSLAGRGERATAAPRGWFLRGPSAPDASRAVLALRSHLVGTLHRLPRANIRRKRNHHSHVPPAAGPGQRSR